MAQAPRFDSNEAIGHRVRLIRVGYGQVQGHARELSQAEFGRITGVGRQALNNAETGDNRLGLDNAIKICIRTGATLDYIYFANEGSLPSALANAIAKIENAKVVKLRPAKSA